MVEDHVQEREQERAVLARQYLAQIDDRDPGSAALVDRTDFLREYASGNATLEEVYRICRARKNQREAQLRKKLRGSGDK